jgi:glycogen operon protein
MRSLVADESYDWEGDTPFSFKSENAIIYEMTQYPGCGLKKLWVL